MKGSFPLLSLLLFMPVIGAVVIGFVPRARQNVAQILGVVFSGITFALAIWLVIGFKTGVPGLQWTESVKWIPSFGISYRLGVDGISVFMVVLTAFMFPLAIIGSGSSIHRAKHLIIFKLWLEAALIGVFISADLFLFFVFWEMMLVPMYFIIGRWGRERRVYAAVKFILYTAFGSAFLLAALIAVAFISGHGGTPTFAFADHLKTSFTLTQQRWLFWGFMISFMVKAPVVPFHTWLPDVHAQAPTAGSGFLAGVLLKLGTYGMLRFCLPLFPRAAVEAVPILLTLGVIGIIYGAFVALGQRDVKRLIAYTSISHIGFIVLGIFAITTTGIVGGVAQMVNHGLITSALFFLIGMFGDRRHTYDLNEWGGLKKNMPIFAGIFLLVTFAAAGLPGLNSFVGEVLTLFGTFAVHRWWAVVGAVGIVLGAIYLFYVYGKLFWGPLDNPKNKVLKDLSPRELVVIVPFVVAILFLDLYPAPMLERITPSAEFVVDRVEKGTKGTKQEYVEPKVTSPLKNPALQKAGPKHDGNAKTGTSPGGQQPAPGGPAGPAGPATTGPGGSPAVPGAPAPGVVTPAVPAPNPAPAPGGGG